MHYNLRNSNLKLGYLGYLWFWTFPVEESFLLRFCCNIGKKKKNKKKNINS